MEITYESDRIRWQATEQHENEAIRAIGDLVFFGPCNTQLAEDIANDHGCIILDERRPEETVLNYCCTPLPMTCDEAEAACTASSGNN